MVNPLISTSPFSFPFPLFLVVITSVMQSVLREEKESCFHGDQKHRFKSYYYEKRTSFFLSCTQPIPWERSLFLPCFPFQTEFLSPVQSLLSLEPVFGAGKETQFKDPPEHLNAGCRAEEAANDRDETSLAEAGVTRICKQCLGYKKKHSRTKAN